MPSPDTREIPLTPPQRWRAFGVCIAVTALTVLDLTKVNVALPSIEDALGASSTELQLVVAGYVLTFGLALVPAGRIGDQRSRRTLFIVGLTVFTLMSLACALAPTSEALLAARLAQGVGAGIQMPQALGLIQALFQGAERARAFGVFGVMVGITMAIGPTLGGLAIAIGGPEDGWRGIFWMNVPLALATLALAIWLLPRTRTASTRRLELDPVGLLLFGAAVLTLLWPFLFTTGSPDDDPARWWLLVVFVVAATVFAAWERRYAASGRQPLIPPRLFRILSYRNGMILASAYFAANPAMLLLTTLYLQHGIGLAPVFAGMVSISFALLSAATAWIGGRLIDRIGRPLVVWGLVTVLAGVGLLVLATLVTPAAATPWAMAAAMAVAGVGGGLVMTPNQTLTLAEIPVRQAGSAGSVGQLGQRIGGAVGTAVGLSFFYSSIYEETGSGESTDLAVYQHAYAFGMLAVALFVALALAVGVMDLGARRRGRRAPG
ncbi:MFS transporter [Microbacterium betulae]|uniref:MFS transporter n=1 Tax=Microbacterium betulae TaxID=2981139 RepID=A0AA97I4R5_9MICO|nr:MFS transporter [Microbacterium sp. AB]WOF22876.1 MFS transporter [Microbacterium sp. AB]